LLGIGLVLHIYTRCKTEGFVTIPLQNEEVQNVFVRLIDIGLPQNHTNVM